MKEKAFGSDCVYPSIFKDYFLEAIYESGYQSKVIYKDLENLSINLVDVKINMYSVNIFLGTIFKHYKKVKFNVLQVKKIYYTNDYQLYNAKIAINYKGSKWLMNLEVGNTLKKFPIGGYQEHILKNLKKKVVFRAYKEEEKLADLFYRVINNLGLNATILHNLYLIYYSNINSNDLGLALENIYKSIYDVIDYEEVNNRISKLSNNKTLKNKWTIYKSINDSIDIEYEDITCCLYLIFLELKERQIKKP